LLHLRKKTNRWRWASWLVVIFYTWDFFLKKWQWAKRLIIIFYTWRKTKRFVLSLHFSTIHFVCT
jgi:hypothetical protein